MPGLGMTQQVSDLSRWQGQLSGCIETHFLNCLLSAHLSDAFLRITGKPPFIRLGPRGSGHSSLDC